jgi:hypothetical protein
VVEKYGRYQSTAGFVAVADVDTDVISFAGRPDSIVLQARVADVLVTLTDELDRETHVIAVVAGEPIETHIGRRRVVARERVAAGGAELFVLGKWAEEGERA